MPKTASWAPIPVLDVRVGDPSSVILKTADREHVDLIVMGMHGLGGFRKWFLGSTTERVLRRTPVPLLTVPSAGLSVVLDASGPRFAIKSILAATDFSEASSNAVQLAAELAHGFGTLVITHVVTPVVVPTQWQPYVAFADEERVTQARERLDKWLRDLPSRIQGESSWRWRVRPILLRPLPQKRVPADRDGLVWRQRRVCSEARLNCVPSSVRFEGPSASGRAPS